MKPSHPYGLTLIELLATTALAGLLMVTLLQVIETTGRSRVTMDASPLYDEAWQFQLANLIRKDIAQARSVRWQDDQLIIEGWNGWDRKTREPAHEPALTVYRLVAAPNASTPGRLLVREQRDLLDLGQQQPTRELMAFGITDWAIISNRGAGIEAGGIARNQPLEDEPDQSILTLTFGQSDPLRVRIPSAHDSMIRGLP
ncbi:MAG: hypothetical protein AAF911_15280 [Planctomycetota bacterium]